MCPINNLSTLAFHHFTTKGQSPIDKLLVCAVLQRHGYEIRVDHTPLDVAVSPEARRVPANILIFGATLVRLVVIGETPEKKSLQQS